MQSNSKLWHNFMCAFLSLFLMTGIIACSSTAETTDEEVTGDDDTTGDDTPGDDTTGDDTPGDDTTGDDTTSDDTTGDDTTGDDTTDPDVLLAQEITNPCGTDIMYALKFVNSTEAYAGCANSDTGNVMYSDDAGQTWSLYSDLEGMRTYAIETDALDRIYFCGTKSGATTKYLYRYDGTNLEAILTSDDLSVETTDGLTMEMTACENISIIDITNNFSSADTKIVVEGLAGQIVWLSEDDGATWLGTFYWEESALDLTEQTYCAESGATNYRICEGYQITDIYFVFDGTLLGLYATGSTEEEYPQFFVPSTIETGDLLPPGVYASEDYSGSYAALNYGWNETASRDATLINMKNTEITLDFYGEARFIYRLDPFGQDLITGGRQEGESGDTVWIATSTNFGASWTLADLPSSGSDTTRDYDYVSDVSCHENGLVCLATVLNDPIATYGSSLFVSSDRGATWAEYTGDFDLTDSELFVVEWNGDNWLAGGNGGVAVFGTLSDLE